MTCVYKEYEAKITMAQGQWPKLKMKLVSGGMKLCWGGGRRWWGWIKTWWKSLPRGIFPGDGGMSKFWLEVDSPLYPLLSLPVGITLLKIPLFLLILFPVTAKLYPWSNLQGIQILKIQFLIQPGVFYDWIFR